jgi:multiple sugar transport system permease protein
MTDLPTSRMDLKTVLSGSSAAAAKDDHSEGMSYLESVPRRLVTL